MMFRVKYPILCAYIRHCFRDIIRDKLQFFAIILTDNKTVFKYGMAEVSNLMEEQKQQYVSWVTENLGEKTGIWYAPYLEKLGALLDRFNLGVGFNDNFFSYLSYPDYKKVYQRITSENDDDIKPILEGKQKRYTKNFVEKNDQWKKQYAQMTFDEGKRSKPDNYGGIPQLGTLLRSYLKFLYYAENSSLTYPKKEKKTSNLDGQVDDNVNYWIYMPGDDAKMWNDFYSDGVMGIDWDYLGDLEKYQSRTDIEKRIAERKSGNVKPANDSKIVWDFYHEVKPGDIIYARAGTKRIIGKGVVIGDYYFDDKVSEYKHRHLVNWTNKGSWDLQDPVAQKILTNFNEYPDWIIYMDQVINDEQIDETSLLINKFRVWLSQQVQQNGEFLNDKTIAQKISSLKDIEKKFNVLIFGETDTEALKDIKETVLADGTYDRYKGVSGSSIDYYIRYVESRPLVEENTPYMLNDFLSEVFIDEEEIGKLQSILQNKKNLILKGAPGVGKTFIADRLAYLMMEEKDDSRIQMIQFHQSYSYEDFIEGYRPKADGEGFELKQGPFVKFARKAARDPERDYFFIIDEINRGNMSKVFGELMMLIETDKRGKSVNLLYSNEKFSVPANLYIIGMMNTADRSLALLDYALRRRFSFYEINPAFENQTFLDYLIKIGNPKRMERVITIIKSMNLQIAEELGKGFRIGHSYFVGAAFEVDPDLRIEEVVEYEIIPQLYEYWFDDEQKADSWSEQLRQAYAED